MALKKAFEILELTSGIAKTVKVGESWKIVDIHLAAASSTTNLYILGVVDNQYLFESNELYNVGFLSAFSPQDKRPVTIWRYLYEKGIWRGIPLSEGQRFYFQYNNALNYMGYVVIEKYDAGDIKSTDPNGTQASEFDYLLKLRPVGSTLSAGDNYYYVDMTYILPFEREGNELKVPPATEITIYGFLATSVYKISSTGANKQYTNYLKIIRARENIYAELDKGFPLTPNLAPTSDGTYIGTGYAMTALYSTLDPRFPLILPEPLVLSEGEKIAVVVNTTVSSGSANLSYTDVPVWMICRVRKVR